jgi:hypothetical protein
MCGAVAPGVEVHRSMYSATPNRKNGVTGFVCPLVNLKALATKPEHLRHERHSFELPFLIKRCEDFVFTPNFYPLTCVRFLFPGLWFSTWLHNDNSSLWSCIPTL